MSPFGPTREAWWTSSTKPLSPRVAPTTAPPGLRPQYHPTYYGAFVHDPDGNNVEAVCHEPKG